MPKVSIIVPIYGVEKYVERCARSLFEQTLDDLEFIFVDDCTPDNSIEVLLDVISNYPNRKEQTNIIHHEKNDGLPVARHTGLQAASGEYILHCDSDDWLDVRTCELLYNKAKTNNSDVVVFDIECTDGEHPISVIKAAKTENVHQFTKDMMYMRSSWSVVNKMFKRSVYDDTILYPQYGVGEDMGLCLQLIYFCKTMSYIPETFYKYYINPLSMTHDVTEVKTLRKYDQDKENADLVCKFYHEHATDQDIVSALDYVRWSVRFMIWGLVYKPEYFKQWKQTYPGVEWRLFTNYEVSCVEKFRILLTYIGLFPRKKDRIIH